MRIIPKWKTSLACCLSVLLLGQSLACIRAAETGGSEITAAPAAEVAAPLNSATQQADNRLKNADFSEQEPITGKWSGQMAASHWREPWIAKGEAGKPTIEAVTDSLSYLHFASGSEPLRAAVTQGAIPVTAGEELLLTYRIKTVNLQSKQGAFVRLQFRDATNRQVSLLPAKDKYSGNTDWTDVRMEVTVPDQAATVDVSCFFEEGSGEAMFTDIFLASKPQDSGTEAPANPDTDSGTAAPVQLEQDFSLPTDKIHVTAIPGATYLIADSSVASYEKGLLLPLKAGQTLVNVQDSQGQNLGQFQLTVTEHQDESFDLMRKQWSLSFAGNAVYDPKNTHMRATFEEKEKNALQLLAELKDNQGKGYLFLASKDYSNPANLRTDYLNLEAIAVQVDNPHSALYRDAEAIRLILESLEYLYKAEYHPDRKMNGNWWQWEIGVPRALTETCCLLYPYMSQEQIMRWTDAIEFFVRDPYHTQSTRDPRRAKGGNQTDISRVKIVSNVLRRDSDKIIDAIKALETIFPYVTEGNGFYPDGSYIDHVNVAYTGAYGKVLLDTASLLMQLTQMDASPRQMDPASVDICYSWIRDSFMPLLHKGDLMDHTRGRSVSRLKEEGHNSSGSVLRAMLRLAYVIPGERGQEIKEFIMRTVDEDRYMSLYESLPAYGDIALLDKLIAERPSYAARKSELKAYNSMARVAYYNQTKDFALGISLYSSKIANFEMMNGENKRGWFTSDGAVYLYNNDLAHYSDHYYPTYNAYYLPGTTELEETRSTKDDENEVTMESDFVGTASFANGDDLTEIGGTLFDFNNFKNRLRMHKSYVILGDKLVLLGSGLENDTALKAYTTVENRKIDKGHDFRILVNGQRQYIDMDQQVQLPKVERLFLEDTTDIDSTGDPGRNLGYHFLEPTKLQLIKETREGAWKDINDTQDDELRRNRFVRSWQEHQNGNSSYAFVLYPSSTPEEFERRTAEQPVKLLKNEAATQLIYDPETQVFAAMKYSDEPLDMSAFIPGMRTLVKKGLYLIQKTNNGLKQAYELVYYHPTEEVHKVADIEQDVLPQLLSYDKTQLEASVLSDRRVLRLLFEEIQQTAVPSEAPTAESKPSIIFATSIPTVAPTAESKPTAVLPTEQPTGPSASVPTVAPTAESKPSATLPTEQPTGPSASVPTVAPTAGTRQQGKSLPRTGERHDHWILALGLLGLSIVCGVLKRRPVD